MARACSLQVDALNVVDHSVLGNTGDFCNSLQPVSQDITFINEALLQGDEEDFVLPENVMKGTLLDR